ncbi:uncharacterized protein [Amphiura filiformis]|uniref:uncharacterized protein n=1 Tax=Amphiura filiformis TaxID=82378 RepID=UPI003B219FC2
MDKREIIRMDLDVSFIMVIIVVAHLCVVQSHLCVLEKRPDPSGGGALRWSLPFAEICYCQGVVAPVYGKTCQRKNVRYKEGDLWFTDDPRPLTMRHNWEKYILDDLLYRTTYCKCNVGTDNCDANAVCTNIPIGSFTCVCYAGYSGDGVTCTDHNECTSSTDNCNANTVCANTVGSFTCTCNAGYSGDGVTCADVDECALSPDNCAANAVCTNTVGSFTCACYDGYNGDGVTCTDHNECTSSTDNCDTNAACTNTAGSFTCACNAGYSGDGVTCTAICIQDCRNDGACTAPDTCTCSPCYTGATCESVLSGIHGPLGLEDGSVTDNQFTASSTYGDLSPYKGRLNNVDFWAASSALLPCWLQVDLLSPVVITGIKTQGATRVAQWIKTFQVKFGIDVNALEYYTLSNIVATFNANTDRTTVVENVINQAIARYFRVMILTFEWHPAMRMEVIGYRCI